VCVIHEERFHLSADFLLVIEEHTVDYDMEVHGVGCDGIYEKVLSIEKDALPPRGSLRIRETGLLGLACKLNGKRLSQN
tara:strand:+ start:5265 stop:5501 length:237 start_codon:yes stop_codon:yes gene_type:complete